MKKIFCYVHNLAALSGSQFKEVKKKWSIFRDKTRCNQLKVEPTFQRNVSPTSLQETNMKQAVSKPAAFSLGYSPTLKMEAI
jgi:hypothetical protein